MGKAWQEEDAQIRAEYNLMAKQIKDELLRKHPNYQYRPRRHGEKKTRRSRRPITGATAGEPQDMDMNATLDIIDQAQDTVQSLDISYTD